MKVLTCYYTKAIVRYVKLDMTYKDFKSKCYVLFFIDLCIHFHILECSIQSTSLLLNLLMFS